MLPPTVSVLIVVAVATKKFIPPGEKSLLASW